MNKLFEKIGKGFVVTIFVILLLAVIYAISWAITIGAIYLICLCFGIEFKLLVATGIWLIICILKSIFNVTVKSKE